jgi:hypothetical protein
VGWARAKRTKWRLQFRMGSATRQRGHVRERPCMVGGILIRALQLPQVRVSKPAPAK